VSGTQLTLDLGHRPAFGRDDFLVAPCNFEAVAWMERWPDWPAHGLAVFGPPGCGKSHLLSVFAAAHAPEPVALLTADGIDPAAVPGLVEANRVVLVDDLDSLCGLAEETTLLHLHNLAREQGRFLMIAGRQPPSRLKLALPDLSSRLNALPAVGIGAPDDEVLSSLMIKLFADRQLEVGAEVVEFLVKRLDRSFAAIGAAVAALDAASLAARRRVTVPLARQYTLSRLAGEAQP